MFINNMYQKPRNFNFCQIRLLSRLPMMESALSQQPDATMEVPPPGYLVADCINKEEGDGGRPFACPEIGCDGFTFDTINECRAHEDDWHNPPYSCSECSMCFAARPALKRHFNSTGHYNWVCEEKECTMKGVLFANRSEFVAHVLHTGGHERLFPTEEFDNLVSPTRINYAEVICITGDDTISESSEEEVYQCLEPSCRRYQQFFHSENEFSRHEESHAHVNAIKYSENLRELGESVVDITTKQEAAREFRCTAEGCPFFGEKLKTSQSFYRHITTPKHLYPLLSSISNPSSPTTEIRYQLHQLNLACDEPECPRYEHRFANYANLMKHNQSIPHLKAVSYGQMKRANLRSESQDDMDIQISEKTQLAATTSVPSTPVKWSSYSFASITPATETSTRISWFPEAVTPTKPSIRNIAPLTPPPPSLSSWREESLMKKNRELESEVQQLKGRIERLRSAYKEQISSLFQALGEKQSRSP
ncbi:hypothetical protein GGI43DRAFT_427510 [Trichoderma evansii]